MHEGSISRPSDVGSCMITFRKTWSPPESTVDMPLVAQNQVDVRLASLERKSNWRSMVRRLPCLSHTKWSESVYRILRSDSNNVSCPSDVRSFLSKLFSSPILTVIRHKCLHNSYAVIAMNSELGSIDGKSGKFETRLYLVQGACSTL